MAKARDGTLMIDSSLRIFSLGVARGLRKVYLQLHLKDHVSPIKIDFLKFAGLEKKVSGDALQLL
jgi:hypothetical protein